MTVDELIKELKKYPRDMRVSIDTDGKKIRFHNYGSFLILASYDFWQVMIWMR